MRNTHSGACVILGRVSCSVLVQSLGEGLWTTFLFDVDKACEQAEMDVQRIFASRGK